MSTKRFAGWVGFALWASGLVAGCDLIEFAKNPSITMTLPSRSYSFSTTDSRWKAPPPGFNQSVSCNIMSDCCRVPMGGPTFECSQFPTLVCDSNVCAVKVDLEVPQTINLKKDAPEFAEIGGRVVEEVLLKELHYVADNQIGVDLPPVDIYVGPGNATNSSNEQVKLLVSLPMIKAGQKVEETIPLSAEAQKAFSMRALDLENPFNLIAGTDVMVRSGTPVPQGKVDITVDGKVTVKF
jgi:hypothetical protein